MRMKKRQYSRAVVFALIAISLAAACNELTGSKTSFLARVDFDESLGIYQLRFRGYDDTSQVFGPTRRPDTPTRTIHTGQTVRIQFPDSFSGKSVAVVVEGIREEQIVARGSASNLVHKGKQVALSVPLQPTDAGTVLPDAGCENCAGCCAYGTCFISGRDSCGVDGGQCVACDRLAADRCAGGTCRCGDGGSCADGLECDAGLCQCTTASCPGCCAANKDGGAPTCQPGDTLRSCGVAGKLCASCSSQCDAGVCVGQCDCPFGCCSGTTCYGGATRDACGFGGSACRVCFPQLSDCTNQSCQCGTNPACMAGQFCNRSTGGDRCGCSPTSCPSGCCRDNYCYTGTLRDFCGTGGQSCQQCQIDEDCQGQRCALIPSP